MSRVRLWEIIKNAKSSKCKFWIERPKMLIFFKYRLCNTLQILNKLWGSSRWWNKNTLILYKFMSFSRWNITISTDEPKHCYNLIILPYCLLFSPNDYLFEVLKQSSKTPCTLGFPSPHPKWQEAPTESHTQSKLKSTDIKIKSTILLR